MNAALLRQEVIDILKYKTVKTDFGEYIDEWVYGGSFRAGVLSQSMSRTVAQNELMFPESRTLIMRTYVPIEESDRIEWDGKQWQVESIVKNKYFNDKEVVITSVEQ